MAHRYNIALCLLVGLATVALSQAASSDSSQAGTCQRELVHANKSISVWAQSMEEMINESKLIANVRELIHNEANTVLDMIEEFGEQIEKEMPIKLAKDLVNIRRRANRLALDVYLRTFDMRWPQNSLQLGVIVERVQQACLDRGTIQALETPANPLETLLKFN